MSILFLKSLPRTKSWAEQSVIGLRSFKILVLGSIAACFPLCLQSGACGEQNTHMGQERYPEPDKSDINTLVEIMGKFHRKFVYVRVDTIDEFYIVTREDATSVGFMIEDDEEDGEEEISGEMLDELIDLAIDPSLN